VFIRQQVSLPCLPEHGLEECLRNVACRQTLPVPGEHRGIPYGIVHVESNKPTEQQVVNHHAFAARGVEHLQQQRRNSFSGAMDGRPVLAYIWMNRGRGSRKTSSAIVRNGRRGWFIGTRCSGLT
jgi:hypothetical protein